LPELVRQISPPGLRDFLLMQPPAAQLGLLVCDSPALVQAAQRSIVSGSYSESQDSQQDSDYVNQMYYDEYDDYL
jgi:hypothetical protein